MLIGMTSNPKQKLVGVLGAALVVSLSSQHATADCGAQEELMRQARAEKKLDAVVAKLSEIENSEGACSARDKEVVRRIAALAFYDRAIAPALADEERRTLIKQGLRYSKPWRMSATLADMEFAQRNFAVAAQLYQDALDDLRDRDLNPAEPPTEAIATIYKRAEQSTLLAGQYVDRVDHRSGKARGLAEPVTRGFATKKSAVPIQFKYREASFTDQGSRAAEELFSILSQQNSPNVTLIGHTDTRGSETFNQKLSEDRAKAVANYLKSKKYGGKIIVSGKGAQEPYVGDGSLQLSEEEVHQQNRRVELERQQ